MTPLKALLPLPLSSSLAVPATEIVPPVIEPPLSVNEPVGFGPGRRSSQSIAGIVQCPGEVDRAARVIDRAKLGGGKRTAQVQSAARNDEDVPWFVNPLLRLIVPDDATTCPPVRFVSGKFMLMVLPVALAWTVPLF